MIELISIFIVALAVSVFFFAGLHYSTGKMMHGRHAAIWAVGSFLVRTALLLGVFYWLSAGSAVRFLVCTGAFILAKIWIVGLKSKAKNGGTHASKS